ncbi:transmembrane protein 198-like isoform X2 [Tachysurus fulvidraco]|uniref:transmembrane protein 198-like isoform X2 n=1 Tax=Tachysurus fulvidraco TaxID=1234273 RepID=UPI000F4EE68B|nr:transmembrane protein 198-like isoform X2 [Tachysurus fulvidraco]
MKAYGDETTKNDMWLHSATPLRPSHAQNNLHTRRKICQPAVTLILILSPDDFRTISDLLLHFGRHSPVKMADIARLVSDEIAKGPAELDPCLLEIDRKYDIVPAVISSTCCLFGIIYCFFGYRCFKAIMFLSGLLFGSVIIFLLCYKERVLDTQLSIEASAGIGLGIGLLCGLVTMLVRSVGLFMTGILLGLLLAIAGLLLTHQLFTPSTLWVPVGVLLGTGMLCAVLTLQWQKFFTIISTAVFGAAIMTVSADYFVELLMLVTHIYDCLRLVSAPAPLCWYSWVIMGIWPMLSIMGALVQWKLTAEGFSHTEVILSRRQKRLQLMRIRQKDVKKLQLSAELPAESPGASDGHRHIPEQPEYRQPYHGGYGL